MKKSSASKLTLSVHAGSIGDTLYGGVVTPIYPSSAYDYEAEVRYPRYYNTPNQKAVVDKLVALENGEDGLIFSSGMAAIMTSLFAMIKAGDHVLFQNDLYGGTHHAALHELERYGMEYSMVDVSDLKRFEKAIRKNTKVIYVETPSNPLLKITDLKGVAKLAKKYGIVTIIDNTFASPVNQNPIDLGIDVVTHSGTKYIGGHSDICCGAMVSSKKLTAQIKQSAMHFGGSLDAQTCYLVERSLKTIVLRVQKQNENALAIARFLEKESRIAKVYYPGLKNHPGYAIAKRQMPGGFGGMLSFEVKTNPDRFIKRLQYIKRAISLGGVESTITQPVKTSHAKLTVADRKVVGIKDNLLRLSVGIEDATDLIADIRQAL
ncbi:MAG TPA: PLP-dependent aspartate aminotransferase family protein [Cyclobacteriaceae bacterium]|jgi:cystathionine beta-lyase/cystathionine gamma-synthase|nr:PLP-dependent aspartate aminotransferase family protein [Cyclobacteriaceae bacterium]